MLLPIKQAEDVEGILEDLRQQRGQEREVFQEAEGT